MRKWNSTIAFNQKPIRGVLIAAAVIVWIGMLGSTVYAQIELEFTDDETGTPISARVEFTKSGKRLSRNKRYTIVGDQWLAEKTLPLSPPLGEFEFLVQRGPEFRNITGGFTMERNAKDTVSVTVPRSINMHAERWYSGDHASPLPIKELSRWQVADAVDMVVTTAPTVAEEPKPPTEPKKKSRDKRNRDEIEEEAPEKPQDIHGYRWMTTSRSFDTRGGGLILHRWPSGQDTPESASTSDATPLDALRALAASIDKPGLVPEISQAWGRDVPIYLSTGTIKSFQILSSVNRPNGDDRLTFTNNDAMKSVFAQVQRTDEKERSASPIFAPISPKDRIRYKDAPGIGKLNEYFYWQVLEAGLRITPTASSGFGKGDNHLGYNRVYAYNESELDPDQWWQSIERGNTTVTNGPLLRTLINGAPPGTMYASYRGQPVELDVQVSLAVREPVDYLDVIFNGETIYSAKLEDHYNKGEFPPIQIAESGWLVVRVITANEKGYRYTTTAPFYFEFDGMPRVSKKAVEFFIGWLNNAKTDIASEAKGNEAWGKFLEQAETYWQNRLAQSTSP